MAKPTSLKQIYKLRQDFILIALTGRTGAGCSYFSDLMSNEQFNSCGFDEPSSAIKKNTDERKYKIAYDFLSKNWEPFYVIRYSNVLSLIAYFDKLENCQQLLEYTFAEFRYEFSVEDKFKRELDSLLTLKSQTQFKTVPAASDTDYAERLFDLFTSDEFKAFNIAFHDALSVTNKLNRILILHTFCNNLRRGGCYYCPIDAEGENIYYIADRIKALIKGKRRKDKNNSCRIIIDSLRNPLEVMYFKERYSAYYTLAINPEEKVKQTQMDAKFGEFAAAVKRVDDIEYGVDTKKTEFYKQNVQKCIEKADLHLSFLEGDEHIYPFNLEQQAVIFYSLMLQPGLIPPSPQERCMQIAYTAKYNSGCISRQVGAVITDQYYSIKSIGWNNTPAGQIPCLLRSADELLEDDQQHIDETAFSDYERNVSGKFNHELKGKYTSMNRTNIEGHNCSYCFKDIQNSLTEGKNQVHTRSLHAEENAMMQISKYGGQGLKDGVLFTTASPCELCSKKAYQLGVKKIFYIDPYPGIAISHVLHSGAKSTIPQLHIFTGAIGRAYHKLYEPFMPYKDELYIRTGLEITNKVSFLEKKVRELEEENKSLKQSAEKK